MHETARAVVEAYANGQIELGAVDAKARGIRHAPGFKINLSSGRSDDKPYTAHEIATFNKEIKKMRREK